MFLASSSKTFDKYFSPQTDSFGAILGPIAPRIGSCSFLRPRGLQHCYPKEIIGGSNKPSGKLRTQYPFKTGFSGSSNGLDPLPNLLYPFSDPLTDRIRRMPRCLSINGRSPVRLRILIHMRRNHPARKPSRESSRIIALICSQGLRLSFPTTSLLKGVGEWRNKRNNNVSRREEAWIVI